jgi:hypothetical protein
MRDDLKAALDRISFASEVLAYALDWSERDGHVVMNGVEVRERLQEWRQARDELDAVTGAQCADDVFGEPPS